MTTLLPAHPDREEAAVGQAYTKSRIALRYWLLGAGMIRAAHAMEYAQDLHSGTRKDGYTPEFAHQVAIVSYLRTLGPHLIDAETTYVAGFLHDVREDYNIPDKTLRDLFGNAAADAVDTMTKTFNGQDRNEDEMFTNIAANPCASIVKLADRIHNLDTMLGVFTAAKAHDYVVETRRLFIPMLHQARRNFPEQEPAYENAKLVLGVQVRLMETLLGQLSPSSSQEEATP